METMSVSYLVVEMALLTILWSDIQQVKGSVPYGISVANFNHDQFLDIAVTNEGSRNIIILYGMRDGTFLVGKPYSTGFNSAPWTLAIGNFNNDSQLDIAVANYRSNKIGIFLGYDNEPFGSMYPYIDYSILKPHSVAIGHIDNDNRANIVIANDGRNNVAIFREIDRSQLSKMGQYTTENGSTLISIALAHLNNDTHLDIVVANSEFDNILLLFGHGDGSFEIGNTYSTGVRSHPYSIAVNDFNNDHILDIAIANFGTSTLLLLYGYGNGTFANQTSYSLGYGYHPYSIAAKDLNGDNRTDIVIACYDTDHVEVFMQTCILS